MRKKERAIGDLITVMITILIMFIVLYFGVDICTRIKLGIDKSRIERTYMLVMETEGYLSAENMALMTQELNELGVTNVSFTGTTTSPAGYGNYIYLCVTGEVEVSGIQGITANGWNWIRGETQIEFRIEQKSTAKY